jgi:hypothetical protein
MILKLSWTAENRYENYSIADDWAKNLTPVVSNMDSPSLYPHICTEFIDITLISYHIYIKYRSLASPSGRVF